MRRDHRSVSRSRRSRGTWRVTTSNPVAPYAGTALEALTRRRNRRFGRSREERPPTRTPCLEARKAALRMCEGVARAVGGPPWA